MVEFLTLKAKVNDEVKTITFEEKEIEVKQYLPLEKKIDMIQIVVQESGTGTVVNGLLADALFHLCLVFNYSNINFSTEDREDKLALYDALDSSGLMAEIISAIPEEEYNLIRDNLVSMMDSYQAHRDSLGGFLDSIQMFAPQKSAEILEQVQSMDLSKYENIMQIAKASGISVVK